MILCSSDVMLIISISSEPELNEHGRLTWWPCFALRTQMVRDLEGEITAEHLVSELLARAIAQTSTFSPPIGSRSAWVADLMSLEYELEAMIRLLLIGALRHELRFEDAGKDGWYRNEGYNDEQRITAVVGPKIGADGVVE